MKKYQCPECNAIYTVSSLVAQTRPAICWQDGQRLVEQPPTLGISVAETIVTKGRTGNG